MKFDVTRYGPGGIEIITVEADGGDDAAAKAFKPGTIIRGIVPSEDRGSKKPTKSGTE